MAKQILSDKTLRSVKPSDKDQRLNDGGGLYLLIKPNGAKWWRFDYSIEGKRKTLSLGVYPVIGLADARRKAEDARKQISNDIDPSDTRKQIGCGRYVFPNSRGDGRPMSENTISIALKTLRYDGNVMTAHGFRTTASTLLNEQGWSPDAIERQLCHMTRSSESGL